ncbi:MAG: hypothetical protein PHQ60_13135 [Sideroxydans sp.]|nr:hypothetical protein [Sideroxydans sp.]
MLKHLCVAVAILLAGCKGDGNVWRNASVPVIQPGATVQLRVVQATNPRLARMSPQQMRILLASAQKTVKENFGVNVEFTQVDETGIERLFALIPPRVLAERKQSIYDFKSGIGDKQKLAAGINATLTERGTKLEQGYGYAKPYLPEVPPPKTLMEFSELLSRVMLERLDNWRSVKAADGAPVLDASPYNEWIYWDTLGYGKLPYELVITNQLLASAEYVDVDIHSAIRGGVSVGTTTYSRDSKFGAYIFWSTFPFLDNSENTVQMRGGETYSAEEAAQLSGTYLAHEIGHLLFQFGHPFGQKSCVMSPVRMLRFRAWSRQIDSAACPIGSRPEMSVGAVPPIFNSNWLRMAGEP